MTLPASAKPFDERAAEYDRWFEDSQVFPLELAAIKAVTTVLPRPRLEIGVGPGRFAQKLEIEFGIDPALAPLQLACRRGIIAIQSVGEYLPIRPAAIGTVYLLFTLCFLVNPQAVIRECARILRPGGRLLIGLIPYDSAWGKELRKRGLAGDPYYRHARFHSIAETKNLLAGNGFRVLEEWSTLRQPPGKNIRDEAPVRGALKNAGLCLLVAAQQGARQ